MSAAFSFEGEVNVNVEASHRRIPVGVLWGAFIVLGWAVWSILTGGGAAHAHEKPNDPVDAVTSLVNNTVTAVTAPVAPVVAEVTTPVVQHVVAPAAKAVAPVVAPVVAAVQQAPVAGPVASAVPPVAEQAVAVVTDTLQDQPVAGAVDPVLDAAAELPVVGALVDDLRPALDATTGSLDDTLGVVAGAADDAVSPVVGALDPTTGNPSNPPSAAPTDGRSTGLGTGVLLPLAAGGALPAASSTPATSVLSARVGDLSPDSQEVADVATPAGDTRVPAGPLSETALAPSATGAGGGGSGGAAADVSASNLSPQHAGVYSSGPSNDDLPTSTVSGTDVSPD